MDQGYQELSQNNDANNNDHIVDIEPSAPRYPDLHTESAEQQETKKKEKFADLFIRIDSKEARKVIRAIEQYKNYENWSKSAASYDTEEWKLLSSNRQLENLINNLETLKKHGYKLNLYDTESKEYEAPIDKSGLSYTCCYWCVSEPESGVKISHIGNDAHNLIQTQLKENPYVVGIEKYNRQARLKIYKKADNEASIKALACTSHSAAFVIGAGIATFITLLATGIIH